MTAVVAKSESFNVSWTLTRRGEFDIYTVNDIKFAVFSKNISCSASLSIDLKDYNVVLWGDLDACTGIKIKATNVLALGRIHSTGEGTTSEIDAQNFYALGAQLSGKVVVNAERDALAFAIDAGKLFLYAKRDAGVTGILTYKNLRVRELFTKAFAEKNWGLLAQALYESAMAIDNPMDKKPLALSAVDGLKFLTGAELADTQPKPKAEEKKAAPKKEAEKEEDLMAIFEELTRASRA